MAVVIKQIIQRTGTGFDAKTWRGMLKEAWERAGRHWHRYILRKHFQRGAYAEYNYQPRTTKYEKRKARVKGHRRPLVWSGQAEREAHRTLDLRVTSKGAKIVLHVPKHLYAYKLPEQRFKKIRGGGVLPYTIHLHDPHKAEELSAVSDRDAELLARVIDKELQKMIDADNRVTELTAGHRTGAAD